MRIALLVIGIVLLAAGIWVLSGGATYPSTDTVLQIGSASLQATHDEAVPSWAGIVGVVIGALLLLAGLIGGRKH